MKKNQANWIKWYQANTGKQWRQEDEQNGAPDLSSLSPREAEVGALLYRRYMREKQDDEAYRYDKLQSEVSARDGRRAQEVAAQKVRLAAAETALAKGQSGTDYAERLTASAEDSAARRQRAIDEGLRATQDKLLAGYAAGRDKRDKTLAADLDAVDSKYRSLWRYNWAKLKESLQVDLASNVSRVDARSYTPEGVAAVKARIRADKESLGDLYDNAMQWAEALPVYSGSDDGEVLSTADGEVYVGRNELKYADLIRYRRGAGNKVTKADVFSVEYNGVRYYLHGDTPVSAKVSGVLDAIAQYKKMSPETGTLLYYRGNLYVYDGDGQWLGTRNVGLESAPHGLAALKRQIKTDMSLKEEE